MRPPRRWSGARSWSEADDPEDVASAGRWPNTFKSASTPMAAMSAITLRRTQICQPRPSRSRCRFTSMQSGRPARARIRPGPAVSLSPLRVLELRLAALGLGQGQVPGADLVVELVLDLVDVRRARVGLGPQVASVGRMPAELEADEVVLLVARQAAVEAVLDQLLPLQPGRVVGGRPDRTRPPVDADRLPDGRLRDIGIEHAGRERPARAHDERVVRPPLTHGDRDHEERDRSKDEKDDPI